jgi:hypothetical protein
LKTDSQPSTRTLAPARNKARFAPRSLALCLAVTLFPLSPLPHSQQALAQSSSNSTKQRIVDGRVDDKAGAAIPGAVVYLKDIKTLAVKSFICGADGKFHFGQLSQNADYELWAELNGKHSKTKRISSFASQNNFNFSLTID